MPELQVCPRAVDDGRSMFRFENRPAEDKTCDYCGSMMGDDFMARLEAGDILLGVTTKTYKVYVRNNGGAPFLGSHRVDEAHTADQSQWKWTTVEREQSKFYFQHLTGDQQKRFVELLNANRIKFDGGYRFNPLPYFVARDPEGVVGE